MGAVRLAPATMPGQQLSYRLQQSVRGLGECCDGAPRCCWCGLFALLTRLGVWLVPAQVALVVLYCTVCSAGNWGNAISSWGEYDDDPAGSALPDW